jgi:TolB-like protein
MRRVISIFFAAVLLAPFSAATAYEKEIKGISSDIAERVSAAGKKTIAVVDFTDLQGNITELGRFIAEELSVDLTLSAKGFEVVDRQHLSSILKEHKLSAAGLVDPNTVKKLGQIAGVDAIVTGSVTPFGDSIRVTCKVIATDTAKVIGASKSDIAKTKAIEELLGRGIESGVGTSGGETRQTTLTKQEAKKGTAPFFQNDLFKITAKSLKKTGNTIKLALLYENITEKNIRTWLDDKNRYLTDESGEIWKLNPSSAVIC